MSWCFEEQEGVPFSTSISYLSSSSVTNPFSSTALTSFYQPLRCLARSSLSRLNQTLVSAGCSHPSGCCRSNFFLTRTERPSQPAAGVCLCAHHSIYRSATQPTRPSAQDLHPDRHLTQLPFRLSLMAPSGAQRTRVLACLK